MSVKIYFSSLYFSTVFDPELSVGLFSSTQPNPTHQITDPTQPNPRVNPTHGQLWFDHCAVSLKPADIRCHYHYTR